MADSTLAERLRAGGIVAPKITIAEARNAGLRLPLACALLEKESSGGHNVFGQDPTIFVKAGKVTRARYAAYKRRRVASTNKLMQGVGPCQLTWWEFQDEADREGGCWRPEINIRVGFRHLAAHIRAHGEADGARRYNGSGKAAIAYSEDLLKRARAWEARLAGALPAPDEPLPAPTGTAPLRRGDRGPVVARLTRRLARLRSPRTGQPYLATASRVLDAEAEAALKAFQAEHRLVADGVFGPLSQGKLNRALRLQRHRAQPGATPAAEPAQPRRAGLRALVGEVHRLDAETGEAWDRLVAYAARRRRLLERHSAAAEARAPAMESAVAEGFAAVTAALQHIDGTLDTLVEAREKPAAEIAAKPAAEIAAKQAAEAAAQPAAEIAAQPAAEIAANAAAKPSAEVAATPAAEAAVVTTAPTGEVAAANVTVAQAAPPPQPVTEGPATLPATGGDGAGPPATPPRRRHLVELSDAELVALIGRLDRALDRSRAVLIRRYAEAEKDLARLAPERPPWPAPAPAPPHEGPRRHRHSPEDVRILQRALNAFTGKRLRGVGPLIVDGVKGHATNKRVRLVKGYLGYTGTARKSAAVDRELMQRLRHPRSARYSTPAMLARALRRRRRQRKAAKASAAPRAGVATFDGRPVAAWFVPHLEWARANGWRGTLQSGWRDPLYSEHLCLNMCGAPSCPGRCAGRASNHAGNVKPAGAIDVSDYATFGVLMRKCPHSPRIFNALGARDPVHFSASGR
jgi:hypothetical protein